MSALDGPPSPPVPDAAPATPSGPAPPDAAVISPAEEAPRPAKAPARRRRPSSALVRVHRIGTVVAWLVILGMIVGVLESTLGRLDTVGSHDWDQMEAHRYLVTKTILRFHQFPFWNPYACGGHPNWGGFESGVTVVSPWMPFYLTMSLAHAMRVEVWGSALLSAVGAWLFAGRFARSPAARALVVVAFSVNGRWALQISTGHTWHLAYGLTPWALYFFDRALAAVPARGLPIGRDVVLCASTLALMVYTGGIYPFPHTVVALGLYAVFVAACRRTHRPLILLGAVGLLTFGLSAPKLLPVVEVMQRWPRIVDSTESIDLGGLVQILTSHDQDVGSRPVEVNARWGWHEFGMYVGWWVVLALLAGALFGRGGRESPLKWIGLLFFVLGFGAFDPHAPWTLLHHWPVFKSQHVPSRWQYPGLLCLLGVTAALADAWLRRSGRLRPWLEIAALAAVGWIAYDVGQVARMPVRHTFATPMPGNKESVGPFHTEIHLPAELAYTSDITSLSLSAEIANIGTIDCSTFPGLNMYVRDSNGRAAGMGAHGVGDPAYRGEAYVSDGIGTATIARWTPNEVTVDVHGARAGEHVVLNQNWDGGWSANGVPALDLADQVAAPLHAADAQIVFRYRPRTFWPGVLFFLATSAGLVALARRRASLASPRSRSRGAPARPPREATDSP